MLDVAGKPVKRNFLHVDDDLVGAIIAALNHPQARQQTMNVCMDEPVDYGELAAYLRDARGLPSVPITTLTDPDMAGPSDPLYVDSTQTVHTVNSGVTLGW